LNRLPPSTKHSNALFVFFPRRTPKEKNYQIDNQDDSEDACHTLPHKNE
jgi:hypothetical protein